MEKTSSFDIGVVDGITQAAGLEKTALGPRMIQAAADAAERIGKTEKGRGRLARMLARRNRVRSNESWGFQHGTAAIAGAKNPKTLNNLSEEQIGKVKDIAKSHDSVLDRIARAAKKTKGYEAPNMDNAELKPRP